MLHLSKIVLKEKKMFVFSLDSRSKLNLLFALLNVYSFLFKLLENALYINC